MASDVQLCDDNGPMRLGTENSVPVLNVRIPGDYWLTVDDDGRTWVATEPPEDGTPVLLVRAWCEEAPDGE